MIKKRKLPLLVLIGIVGCCLVAGGIFAISSISVEKDRNTYGALLEVCSGNPVPSAAAYTKSSGVHPAVGIKLIGSDNYSVYNYAIPENARAAAVNDAQVVFCMSNEPEKVLVERCPYGDENSDAVTNIVERYQYELVVRLYEARTGALIAEENLSGKPPRECLDTEAFPENTETLTVEGEKVSDDDIEAWLRPHIIVP